MKYYSTRAIILKMINYGEADKILTLFSRERGKFSAIVKSVRKTKSKMKGQIQLFSLLDMVIHEGKGLDIIKEVSSKGIFDNIRSNPMSYVYACYFSELINYSIVAENPQEEIYDLLIDVLSALGTVDNKLLARYFEIHLLSALGLNISIDYCAECGEKIIGTLYYSVTTGGFICGNCGIKGGQVGEPLIKAIRYMLNSDLNQLSRLKIDQKTERDLELLLDEFIKYHLDSSLKSRIVLKDME